MEPSRCKRCGVWVYDGSPLCPNCTKRHNEVYNHAINYQDQVIEFYDEPISRWPRFGIIVIGILTLLTLYILINHFKNTYVDIESFPPHAQVFEFDEYLFRTKTNSPLRFQTDGNFGYFIKIIDIDMNHTILSVFLHPSQTYELSIPTGNYIFVYGLGKKWENIITYFGDNGKYYQSNVIYNFDEKRGYLIYFNDMGSLNSKELYLNSSVYK